MALDRLLRVLSPPGSTPQSGGPAHAAGQDLGSSVACRLSAAAHLGSSSQPRDVSSNHGHPGAVPFPDRSEQAADLPTAPGAAAWPVHAGQERSCGLGEEGEAWKAVQQALMALLEQEHAAGSAAHAWQVSGFSFLSTGACQISVSGVACNLEL